jgi:hypothetical protein
MTSLETRTIRSGPEPGPWPLPAAAATLLLAICGAIAGGFLLLAVTLSTALAGPARVPAADREAILGMAGEFAVTFRFAETTAVRPGYEPRPGPYTARGTELVVIIEDRPDRIQLQHLLLEPGSGRVTKHWRQVWQYEPVELLEFAGKRRWQRRPLPAGNGTGAWSQTVHEVDDSPRYASYGHWVHGVDASTWTSAETWRPLPRREWTTRSDYDVLRGVNRHVVTRSGWRHEQDNEKLDLQRNPASPVIVRERGDNDYCRVTDVDFQPAWRYWSRSQRYWRAVREAWDQAFANGLEREVATHGDTGAVMEQLLGLAESGGPEPAARTSRRDLRRRTGRARAIIAASVRPVGEPGQSEPVAASQPRRRIGSELVPRTPGAALAP